MESASALERDSEIIERILNVIRYFAVGIEVFAVVVITVSMISASTIYIKQRRKKDNEGMAYRAFRGRLGLGLLLGLEILVAADVVRTVALEPTLQSAAVLGMLVVIRIALSWSLVVEVEHRWPWQPEKTRTSEE
jgi:uncharacterized membrane protein